MKFINTLFRHAQALGLDISNVNFNRKILFIYRSYLLQSRVDKKQAEIIAIKALRGLVANANHVPSFENKYSLLFSKPINAFLALCEKALEPIESNQQDLDIQIIAYHGLHPKIKPADIKLNGKIISDEEITIAPNALAQKPDGSNIKIDRYEITKINNHIYGLYSCLGAGEFGKVYLAQDLESGEWNVIKNIKLTHKVVYTQNIIDMYNREVSILTDLQEITGSVIDQHAKMAHLGMKLVSGVPLEKLVEDEACAFIWLKRIISMLEATKKLHNKHVLHGDLKLGNMLCDTNDNVSLIDNGLSHKLQPDSQATKFNSQVCPKLYEKSPEMQQKIISTKTEVFALGFIIPTLIQTLIETKKLKLPTALVGKINALASKMTSYDPQDRPALEECINEFKKIQSECLEVLSHFRNVGLVKLDELLDNQGKVKTTMLTPLRLMNKVYLVPPAKEHALPQEKVNTVLSLLSKEGVRIAGTVNVLNNSLSNEDIIIHSKGLIENETQLTDMNNYFYISGQKITNLNNLTANEINVLPVESKKAKKDYVHDIQRLPKLSLNHYMLVMEALQNEVDRLKERYDKKYSKNKHGDSFAAIVIKKRISLLETKLSAFSNLYAHDQLSHHNMLSELENLQKEMNHTNSLKGFFVDIFGLDASTRGAKNIKSIRNTLQSETIHTKWNKSR